MFDYVYNVTGIWVVLNCYARFWSVFLDFISAAMFASPAGDSRPDSLAAIMMSISVGADFKLAGVGVMRRFRYNLRGIFTPFLLFLMYII